MSYFVVDVESDGPIPGPYSMISIGAIKVDEKLDKTFFATFHPISEKWDPHALSISSISREVHMTYSDPRESMEKFYEWIKSVNKSGSPVMWSDNIAYDWQFVNYYFHTYMGANIFGFSGRRIGDLYCGMVGDLFAKWKHLRKTPHTHHPVDDAKGNAEALIGMLKNVGIKTEKL